MNGFNKLIAIVDDEPDIAELVSINLKKAGFHVEGFQTADSFFKFLEGKLPDLIILDLMLPDDDGLEVCKRLKKDIKFSAIPVIILSARDQEIDKVLGLELGADDYVTKPFSPKELAARVKTVLRRNRNKEESNQIEIGKILVIDLERYEVFVDGKKAGLTPVEFSILKILTSKKGWVFSRDRILDYLWGNEKAVLDRTVDVHIKNLRGKLGKAARFIKNIRGVGYKLEEE